MNTDNITAKEMNIEIALFDKLYERYNPLPGVMMNNRLFMEYLSSREELKYHTSWNWLMPVWFKCQHIGADKGLAHKKFWNAFHVGIDEGNILKCHTAIYEFVIWLKNQK